MKRIQRRRTKGYRLPPNAVYVGRPTRWGNGFRPETLDMRGRPLGLERAIDLYRICTLRWIEDGPPDQVAAWLAPLRGHDLACWCGLCEAHRDGRPVGVECSDCPPCHADFLLELAA